MKKHLVTISLLLVVVLTTGCTKETTDKPVPGTQVESNELQSFDKNTSSNPTESDNSEIATETEKDSDNSQNNNESESNIVIRQIVDGYTEEIKNDNNTSSYRMYWCQQNDNAPLLIAFDSLQNLGSWVEANQESGVIRCITDNCWFTLAIWQMYLTDGESTGESVLKDMSIETVQSMLSDLYIKEDSLSYSDKESCEILTMDFTRNDSEMSGKAVIINVPEQNSQWLLQFLMTNETFDNDMLQMTIESIKYDSTISEDELKQKFDEQKFSPMEISPGF